jgi:hypothetical protein
MTRECGIVERAPAHGAIVDARALREQPPDRVDVAAPGRVHQRLLAERIGFVHVRAARHQHFHHRQVAVPGRDHQAGADAVGQVVRIHPGIEPGAHLADVAGFQANAVGHGIGRKNRLSRARVCRIALLYLDLRRYQALRLADARR